jgi:hypothetical protein
LGCPPTPSCAPTQPIETRTQLAPTGGVGPSPSFVRIAL